MRTSMKTLLAVAGAGVLLAACATEPYDYAYGYGDAYPAYGYYGYYGYEPGYYYGPSVDYGYGYHGGDRDGRWHHGGGYDHHGGGDGNDGPGNNGLACCGPGSGPGGSVTQHDAERWGAGG